MSETGSRFDRPGAERIRPGAEDIGHDLEALRSLTARDQPGLETSLRAARGRSGRVPEEGMTMAIRFLTRRPAVATMLGMVVVALGLLALPISYQRTVGYDVALTLAGGTSEPPQVREIASGLKETLGAPSVAVVASTENGRLTYVLEASAAGDVRGSAEAFAKELEALGYAVSVSAVPRKETISGNVYAYAMSRVIEISTDGKSAAELESEIRARLVAAGVTRAQVSVIDLGADKRAVKIEANHQAFAGAPHEEIPELVLTKDGKPIEGGCTVKVTMKKDAAGVTSLVLTVTADGRTATEEIPNADSMSDAALAAEIEKRLLAAGIDVVVGVHGDQITVEKRQP